MSQRLNQAGDIPARQFASQLGVCYRTIQNWMSRVGRKKLNGVKYGRTVFITAPEQERFRKVCAL